MREATRASRFLGEARMSLAEAKISKALPEFASLCQHIVSTCGDLWKLPVSEITPIARTKKAPALLKAPVCVEAQRGWKAKRWGMSFWGYECSEVPVKAYRRYPPSSMEVSPIRHPLETSLGEYTKYVGVIRDMDPQCLEANTLAYPRFIVGGFSPWPYSSKANKLWEQDFSSDRKLWAPPGLKDLTSEWLKKCCPDLDVNYFDTLRALDQLQFGAPGSLTRLHVENNSAHVWLAQIQGRRMFILFPPQDRANLYAEQSDPDPESEERSLTSPVDVFRPSQKHSRFQDSRAHAVLLEPGETLIVPSGWWHCSVALEPFTTLTRRFWNRSNRVGLCDEVAFRAEQKEMTPEIQSRIASRLPRLREWLHQEDFSSGED
eukprot:TRINITY_DN35625_c0_g1_i1.p1 TRINITY_DN35625_c0_g1~~TRINITY_DN35625_c0_g1_i1.p1  ORF type:complete len:376 (+),score=52.69 TRINITY_DN35625_c0_g1_i1:835-1962(+)